MKRKNVWIIASLTLLTVPLAFWVIGDPDTTLKTIVIYLSFSPLGIAVILELVIDYKSDVTTEGSPMGNALAKILGSIIFLGVIAIVFKMVST